MLVWGSLTVSGMLLDAVGAARRVDPEFDHVDYDAAWVGIAEDFPELVYPAPGIVVTVSGVKYYTMPAVVSVDGVQVTIGLRRTQ